MMTTTMLRTLAVLVLLAQSCPAHSEAESGDADSRTAKGVLDVTAIIKKKGRDCGTGITQNCKPGKPCFANIEIEGDSAKALWTMLHAHGTKSSEVSGDYVATKSEALQCSETDGKYHCTIGYDAVKNTLTAPEYCDPE